MRQAAKEKKRQNPPRGNVVKIKDVPRYKTAKCNEYEKDGYCNLGVHC